MIQHPIFCCPANPSKKRSVIQYGKRKPIINQVQTFTTGPIFRDVNTDFIQVSALNLSNSPQTVTISVIDWQNTCNEDEFPKFGFLCGELITDPDGAAAQAAPPVQAQQEAILFVQPDIPPVLTPFTFTIPARQLFTIQAYPPTPILPPNPCYEVRVTHPPNPLFPPSPTKVNTWGISASGNIQPGNTVLHHQFTLYPPGPL